MKVILFVFHNKNFKTMVQITI